MARPPTAEEKERIAAGPRYKPEAPKPPWRERKVAKGEAPPKPPPAPPTLEPVIPQPYIEPKDAKVISTDVKGNPTIVQTPDGEKHYTPYQTVMWGNYGFKTESEYVKSQQTGKPSQYIGITKGVETPVLVSRAQMAEASKLKGEEQFQAFRKLGAIPFGSKFLPGPGGYQGRDWNWIHPDTIKKYKGQIIARLARASTKKPRVVIPAEMKIDIKPPYREKRPIPARVKPPLAPPAFRELIDQPEAVARKLKKEPTLENIQEIIEDWKKAQGWAEKLDYWHPSTRIRASLAEFSGEEQKGYFDRLETYNNRVITYNNQIEEMNKIAQDLEKEGATLGIDKITKYNDEMARLNALAASWEREAAGINLENEAAIRLHNKKLENINQGFKAIMGQEVGLQAAIQRINAFNTKIDKFNTRLAAIPGPGEAPETPPKTVGNIARAIFDGIVMEYEKATRKELTLKEKIRNVNLLTAELLVPGVWIASPYFGTKLKDRSLSNILLNVGLDLLVVIPLLRAGTILFKRALGVTAKGAVKQVVVAEAKILKKSIQALSKSYGKAPAQTLKRVAHLQGVYLKRLAKLERLKAAGKPFARQAKATMQIENKLRAAARDFTSEIKQAQTKLGKKGIVGAGFDSPELAQAFFKMPEELIRHTKGVLQAITRAKPAKIKQLQANVDKAETVLKAAQAKYPLDPSRWTDLVGDLLQRQAMLTQAKAGSLATIQQELTRVVERLGRIRARMKAPGLKVKQRRALKTTELNLERQRLDLIQKLDAGIRTMELEWGRGGAIMGGSRVATVIRPKRITPLTGAPVATPTAATMTSAQVAARTAIGAEVIKVIGTPIPEVVEIVKGLPTIKVIKAVETETIKAIRAAEKLAALPVEQTKLDTKQKLGAEIIAQTKLALELAAKAAKAGAIARALALKAAPIGKAAEKVGLKVAELPKPLKPIPPKPIPIPRKPPAKKDKEIRKRIKAANGAIAWRQGELQGKDRWEVGLYPYDSDNLWLTVFGRKPAGATIVKGPGSAYQTITLLYGKAPASKVTRKIGFFYVEIMPTGPKTIGIRFTPIGQSLKIPDKALPTVTKRQPPLFERDPFPLEKRYRLPRRKLPRITPRTPRLRR